MAQGTEVLEAQGTEGMVAQCTEVLEAKRTEGMAAEQLSRKEAVIASVRTGVLAKARIHLPSHLDLTRALVR